MPSHEMYCKNKSAIENLYVLKKFIKHFMRLKLTVSDSIKSKRNSSFSLQ